MSVGRDVSSFYPAVVINIVNTSFEVKNLVYIYLVRCVSLAPPPTRASSPRPHRTATPSSAQMKRCCQSTPSRRT